MQIKNIKFICDPPPKINGKYNYRAVIGKRLRSQEKEIILDYFARFTDPCACTTEKVIDPFTGEKQKEYDNDFTDGIWTWSAFFIYCFEKYDMGLNRDFISCVLNQTKRSKNNG